MIFPWKISYKNKDEVEKEKKKSNFSFRLVRWFFFPSKFPFPQTEDT